MKLCEYNELVYNSYDEEKYVVLKRTLKQTRNHGFVLKEGHRIKNSIKTITETIS